MTRESPLAFGAGVQGARHRPKTARTTPVAGGRTPARRGTGASSRRGRRQLWPMHVPRSNGRKPSRGLWRATSTDARRLSARPWQSLRNSRRLRRAAAGRHWFNPAFPRHPMRRRCLRVGLVTRRTAKMTDARTPRKSPLALVVPNECLVRFGEQLRFKIHDANHLPQKARAMRPFICVGYLALSVSSSKRIMTRLFVARNFRRPKRYRAFTERRILKARRDSIPPVSRPSLSLRWFQIVSACVRSCSLFLHLIRCQRSGEESFEQSAAGVLADRAGAYPLQRLRAVKTQKKVSDCLAHP